MKQRRRPRGSTNHPSGTSSLDDLLAAEVKRIGATTRREQLVGTAALVAGMALTIMLIVIAIQH